METFLQKYKSDIYGILHGFDRMIIKGHIQSLFINNNFYYYLQQENVQLKDFNQYALHATEMIKNRINDIKEKTDCYYQYLVGHGESKENIAKKVMQENPEKEGLICILSAVEPCYTLTVRYNKATNKLERANEYRKCLHYYFYYNDRDFGLMHVRLQTWLPYGIQIYINGKEYLKRQLTKEQIEFTSYDNSITWVSDIDRAQAIADKFIEKKWYSTFDRFARQINSFLPRIEEIFGKGYIWCIEQSEYASDVLFKDREILQNYYPYFLEYASLCQMGENIYTFFGRKAHHSCQGEAVSDRKNYFGQGFRVKFTLDKNSLKMYDKDSVLRVETTINNSRAFKTHNPNPQGKTKWLPMGKNISNLYRYAQIARQCNERYLSSLAIPNRKNDLDKRIEDLCQPKKTKLSQKSANARQYSALNPLKKFTIKLFNAVMNGAYFIKGFSNKEIMKSMISLEAFKKEQLADLKKLSGKINREIAKLRAHNIVQKLPHSFKYRVTSKGKEVLDRILMFKKIDLKVC